MDVTPIDGLQICSAVHRVGALWCRSENLPNSTRSTFYTSGPLTEAPERTTIAWRMALYRDISAQSLAPTSHSCAFSLWPIKIFYSHTHASASTLLTYRYDFAIDHEKRLRGARSIVLNLGTRGDLSLIMHHDGCGTLTVSDCLRSCPLTILTAHDCLPTVTCGRQRQSQ
ncbi:hypothetical protein SCHPADRAFT_304505 [Schizopora paradoxa]|uniref:Uncharacterized protein n=1 Tax=Schizopora paradoxa TaxID=27342 RepID=A0A0H2SCD1_9AGAM|nr:hypothetical protein SCHPADRAFT_304505 [Schizopora paradoxa]